MAKKKEEDLNLEINYLDVITKQITKEFGEGTFVNASEILDKKQIVIPFSPSIDAICGGVPQGSTVTINGWFKTGKSTSALSLAANAQKPEYGNHFVTYLDAEARIKEKNLHGVEGLDLSPDKFKIIQSAPGKILTSQDALKQVEIILNTRPNSFIIVDSISALVDANSFGNEIGKSDMGKSQQTISQFVQKTSNVIRVMNSIIVYITHRIASPGKWGDASSEKVANRVLYQADLRLRIKSSGMWLDNNKYPIGKVMKIVCEESAMSMPPGLMAESYLRFGKGIDRLYENLQFGLSTGLISPKGAWCEFNFLNPELLKETEFADKEKVMVQGVENAYKALLKYPKWKEELETRIKGFMGSLVKTSEGE